MVQIWLAAPAIVHAGQIEGAVSLADLHALVDEHGQPCLGECPFGGFHIQPVIVIAQHGIHAVAGIETGQDRGQLEGRLLVAPDIIPRQDGQVRPQFVGHLDSPPDQLRPGKGLQMDVAQLHDRESLERRFQVFDRDLDPLHHRCVGLIVYLDLANRCQKSPGCKKTAQLHELPAIH